MKNRILSGAGAILSGLLISIGPQTIFKVCTTKPGGSFMKCHWTAQAEIGVGLLIAVLGVLLLVFSSHPVRLGLSLGVTLAGILAVLFPYVLIGGCPMETMECQRVAFPAITVIAVLTIAGFVFNSVFLFLSVRNRKEGNG